jgi:CBS domain-containing protein
MNDMSDFSTCESAAEPSVYSGLLRACQTLPVERVMSRDVVAVRSDTTVQEAARIMSEDRLSCLPVVDNGVFRGILRQQDALRDLSAMNGQGPAPTVGQRMRLDVRTVGPETLLLDAAHMMEATRVKWLPVFRETELVGIVSQSDVTRALTSVVRMTEVAEIMSMDVTTVDAQATVAETAQLMERKHLSCIVASHGNRVCGILTEKDLLGRIVAPAKDPNSVRVAEIMSSPVVSVGPSHSLFSACSMMNRRHIHRLVVMDDDQLCGIITHTDILQALDEALHEQAVEAGHGRDRL